MLVGALKACLDSQSRQGFYGACVAVHPDTKQQFTDWTACGDDINRLFMKLAGQVDGESGQRRFAGKEIVCPTRRDELVKWRAAQGRMLLLHSEEAGFPDILQKLQAVAYAQGHMYPTAVALQAVVPGAQSLSADTVTKVLAKWSDDRDRAVRERVGGPDEGDTNGYERTSSDNEGDNVGRRIDRLEQDMKSLRWSVIKRFQKLDEPVKWSRWLLIGSNLIVIALSMAAVVIALVAIP